MTQHPWLDPSPFFFPGGRNGVLLIHGFTGAPTEMRPLGEYLHQRGFTVSGPLLPGHGTSVEDLADRKWSEWVMAVETAYRELAAQCKWLAVGGLSLGSLLAMYLAARPPDGRLPEGIALYSPAIMVADIRMRLSWIGNIFPITVPKEEKDDDLIDPEADSRVWCYDAYPSRAVHQVNLFTRRVRGMLPLVTVPTLVVMSKGDRTLRFESGPIVMEKIASKDKELVTLRNSGHNILCNGERENIWEKTAAFFDRLSTLETDGALFRKYA